MTGAQFHGTDLPILHGSNCDKVVKDYVMRDCINSRHMNYFALPGLLMRSRHREAESEIRECEAETKNYETETSLVK